MHPVRSSLSSVADPGRTNEVKPPRPLHRGNNLDGIRIFVFTLDSNVHSITETLEKHSPSVYILQIYYKIEEIRSIGISEFTT